MKTLPIKLATLILVFLVLSEHLSEAKKRKNPNTQITQHHRRRRPPPPRPSTVGLPPPPKPKKKKSILTSLFNRKSKKHGGGGRGRRVKSHNAEESKRVYYYSLPTQKPRIILGEELNFSELGIHNAKTKHIPQQYQPTGYIQEDSDYYNPSTTTHTKPNNPYNNHPKYYKKPRLASSPPGYRIRDNWEDHYVLEHNNRPGSTKDKKRHPKQPPKVMDSVMRAAGELRNAYKAAVIGSAKVAHYTGAAASNYFKGVRNIFSGGRVSGGSYRKKDVTEESSADKLKSDLIVPSPSLLSNDEEEHEATQPSSSIPSVHLDWGSSFWKLFYNKSGRNVGSLSQVESRVDQIVNNS